MDGIFVLLTLILKITMLGFLTFVVVNFLRNVKRRNLREEIAKIEAKMASLRINLKSRVKKKAKVFRATYPLAINSGEPVDLCINGLAALTFEKGSDFQDYIELSRKINHFINVASVDKNSEPSNPGVQTPEKYDFMGTDFKNEIYIIRLINDVVAVSKTLTKQITRYNSLERKISIAPVEPVYFRSLFELQKVFLNKDHNDEDTEKLTEEPKSA